MSINVLAAGTGYQYLTSQVAAHDVGPELGEDLTSYYTRSGNPPGRWMGSGTARLGVAGAVTEQQMERLFGHGLHPETGELLGQRYRVYKSVEERIELALADEPLASPERQAEIADAVAKVGHRQAVAGFDCTFSPVKSVSVYWTIGDDAVRQAIEQAHIDAVSDTIGWIEADVARTRAGADGIEFREVEGLVVTAFDHRTSRAGDPQLHTHAVIANRVWDPTEVRLKDGTVVEGKWRSLDSRAVHKAVVAASEHYNLVLEEHLADALDVEFTEAGRGIREIAGIDPQLIKEFSKRAEMTRDRFDELVTDYTRTHGRQPDAVTQHDLRQQAVLDTRARKKTGTSAADERRLHRRIAERVAGRSVVDEAAKVPEAAARVRSERTASARPDEALDARGRHTATPADLDRLTTETLEGLMERRATWTLRHVRAEAARHVKRPLTDPLDPDGPGRMLADPAGNTDVITERVIDASVSLAAPHTTAVPDRLELDRLGGTAWQPAADVSYTSPRILAAEDQLLAAHRRTDGPVLDAGRVDGLLAGDLGDSLSADQAAAVEHLTTSGRPLDLLIGPAGAGKTTTLRALIGVYRDAGHDVTGLATSANAAKVLSDECSIPTDNTAKWRHTHRTTPGEGIDSFRPGQLVLVDEAGMAGTLTLDELTATATAQGAKVVLVGDYRQLGAVEAGGALRLLHHTGGGAELHHLHRFNEPWEADATSRIRDGDPTVSHIYDANGRLHFGLTAVMRDDVYEAWRTDTDAGKTSLMIAPTNDDVTRLNNRARRHLVERGRVSAKRPVELHNGSEASRGDVIVTRRNDRDNRFHSNRDWVRNGDLWTVERTGRDGSLQVRHLEHNAVVALDARYAAEHVELGYASTIHRAQGSTVDTAHTYVDDTMGHDSLYVAMSRGRDANHAYLATDGIDPDGERPVMAGPVTPAEAFAQAIGRSQPELSAHETIDAAFEHESAITTLAGRYRHVLALIDQQRPPVRSVLDPGDVDAVTTSPVWPRLEQRLEALRTAGLTDAEIHDRLYPDPSLRGSGPLAEADEPAGRAMWRLRQHDQPAADVVPPLPSPAAAGDVQLDVYARQLHDELTGRLAAEPLWYPEPGTTDTDISVLPDQLHRDLTDFRLTTGWEGHHPLGPLPDNHQHRPAWRTLRTQLESHTAPPALDAEAAPQPTNRDRLRDLLDDTSPAAVDVDEREPADVDEDRWRYDHDPGPEPYIEPGPEPEF